MMLSDANFAAHAQLVALGGAETASSLDPVDVVFAAARTSCSAGPTSASVATRLYAYDNDPAFVVEVMELADVYRKALPRNSFLATAAREAPSRGARIALDCAAAQLGLP